MKINTIDTMINTKVIKWIAYGIEAAIVALLIILCITVGAKNKKIKAYKATVKAQTETIDSLKAKCDQLWGMDCITVNTICNIQQKGLVNTTASTQISKSVAEYTRGEVLMALDSITKANNTK